MAFESQNTDISFCSTVGKTKRNVKTETFESVKKRKNNFKILNVAF